ncbi:MAG: thermonuclease family protein [Candidatus Heimdallarchaeaceae archaeon]
MTRKFKAKVVGVTDGDTLRLSGRRRTPKYIRIAGLNAPEKGQFGYSKAKRSLSQRVLGRTMTFQPVGKSYGRTVAKIPGLKRKLPPKGRR